MASVHATLKSVKAAAKLLDDYERPTFTAPATPEQIEFLETAVGCELPSDVRAFFLAHDCISAMDVHKGYSIGDSAVLIRSITRGDFPGTISSTPVFPIGTDGGGNSFLTSFVNDGPVWKWRHDIGDFVVVAESVVLFLDRLAADIRAFADDQTDWDFMAG